MTHTGNQRGFVKAEVIGFEDLAGAGSRASTKSAGKARIQGKDCIMRDVDVVESCFNTWGCCLPGDCSALSQDGICG